MNNIEKELEQLHFGLNILSPLSKNSWGTSKTLFKKVSIVDKIIYFYRRLCDMLFLYILRIIPIFQF